MQILKKKRFKYACIFLNAIKMSYSIQSRDWCNSFYKAKWGPVFITLGGSIDSLSFKTFNFIV